MPALLRAAAPSGRRWLRAATSAVAPALIAACGDSTTSPSDLAGTYAMVSYNGQSLPYTDNSDPRYTSILTDGQLVLQSDRTYRIDVSYRDIDRSTGSAATFSDSDTGTYTLSGATITLRSDDATVGTFSGSVSSSTISVERFVFVRR